MLRKTIFTILLTTQLFTAEYAPHMAQKHIGEKATVCGLVASTYYASTSNGEPTFLNLGEAYPNHVFTAVIWGDNREQFDEPEMKYRGKTICVTGKIKSYRGMAEIVLYSQKQVRVK